MEEAPVEPTGTFAVMTDSREDSAMQNDLSNINDKSVVNKIESSASSTLNRTTTAANTKLKTKVNINVRVNSTGMRSNLMKSTTSSASRSVNSAPVPRRNSTGGLPEKQAALVGKKVGADVSTVATKMSGSSTTEPLRKSLPDVRRNSVHSVSSLTTGKPASLETKKSTLLSPASRTPRASINSESSKQDTSKKLSVKPSPPAVSSTRRTPSTSVDSTNSVGSVRRAVPKVSSPSSSARSPSVCSGSKAGLLDRSVDRSSSLSGRRKAGTPESRDSRLIMLPQVEVKAGDDMRLDLRGHRIRSLSNSGLNLSPTLEFVYLRDNLLSALDGIEKLHRVKVLDLSFNDFRGPGFEPLGNCKVLQQLYLAGNQITSLSSLPELPNLEFLSVAQNKLKSLSMASQPRLQVLAASKNKISTLKGFPHLPALEHLRLEENPILKMRHLEAASILLIGPTLKKFNDRDLSREETAIAKRYPAHTAFCIRGGWELCRSEQAQESTFKFLLEQWKEQLPSGYQLIKASADCPFEGDACYCHFDFIKCTIENNEESTESNDSELELKYQWFIGDRVPSNFKTILGATDDVYIPSHEDVGKSLKVECTTFLGETELLTIFAISSPVLPGTGQPKVLKIDVRGELVEGTIIRGYSEVAWCGGTPGRGVSSWLRRKWNSSPVVIAGAEHEEYRLTLDDVDSCLVYMYTPVTEEATKGEPQYAITDYIKAAPPSVNNVQITGDAVEGNIIKGAGEYFGGREGPSKFEWLREDIETGEFGLVSSGTSEYPLTKEDVGRRLAFVYIPVNFEGQEGNSVSVVSQIVKKAPPKATNVKIIGELKEGSKVTVTGSVTGGTEGSSRVQWFKTSSKTLEDENVLEALTTSKIAKAFRVPLGAVGYYLVAKFTPMTPDGEAGEPAYVLSEKTIATLPPSLNFLSITGDYIEGELLTASYGYIGGHEGKSIFNWYLHEGKTDQGELISKASGLLQYRITGNAIGKFLSFTCTPVRDDGVIGESKTCMGQEGVRAGSPRLLSLQIVGAAVEGATLNVDKKYWGGEEGESVYRWFRSDSQGTQFEINDATSSSYIVSYDDIGYFLSVSCEPVRNDSARGPTLTSEQVGFVLPGPPTCKSLEFSGSLIEGQRVSFTVTYSGGDRGNCSFEWSRVKNNGVKEKLKNSDFLDLTIDDVGTCIEIVYTPVRRDGVKGTQKTLISGPVAPGDPVGIDLVIPECCEDKLVVPQKRYFGGEEGVGEYIWYRCKSQLEDSALMGIANSSDDVHICARTLTYTPSLLDVGSFLALYWLPTREDGISGKPLISICKAPVTPAFPLVSNVRIKELSFNTYVGEGEYSGGYEGSSLFNWYRKSDDGTVSLIDGADSRTYETTDKDYTCCLIFGYTPVRSDSTVGELKLSEPTNEILPEVPRIEMLALTGNAIEGDTLTAIEIIPKSEAQHHTWSKYKREINYQWFSSSNEFRESKLFEPLPMQNLCSYKPRLEDIGNCLRCECIVTDVFGRSSEPVYAESTAILPGIPKIKKLEIEGRGFHTNLYAVRGHYSGGREGKSKIQWLRSMIGSPDLITIPGETGRMYEANVDDVGYRLVVIYTPVREDGTEGQPVSASTDPISVEPDILREVKQKLDLGSVKFEVLCNKDRSLKKGHELGSLERRILEVNRKRTKVVKPGSKTSFPTTEIRGSYTPPFHVELFRNDQHRLRIVVDSENEVDLMVQTRHLRDVIVLVIRGLAQKFNSTSLNSLLKTET